jgi:murein DD-endopeptidase
MNRFIGVPYVPDGRAWEGVDCYGLVWLFFHSHFGIDLPRFDGGFAASTAAGRAANAASLSSAANRSGWKAIATPDRVGDAVLMRVGNDVCHVGVIIEPGSLLHSERPPGSVIQRLSDAAVAQRIVSFLRHEALC